jgi:hypothetical protein
MLQRASRATGDEGHRGIDFEHDEKEPNKLGHSQTRPPGRRLAMNVHWQHGTCSIQCTLEVNTASGPGSAAAAGAVAA